jgi:hypothetical protein
VQALVHSEKPSNASVTVESFMNATSSTSMVAIQCLALVLALVGSGALASPTTGRKHVAAIAGIHVGASGFSKSGTYVPSFARVETTLGLLSLKQDSDGSGVYKSCPDGFDNADVASISTACEACWHSEDPAECSSDCCIVPLGDATMLCEVNGWYLLSFRKQFLHAASGIEWSPQ